MKIYAITTGFPNCCGALEVGSFYNSCGGWRVDLSTISPKDRGLMIATTIALQVDAIEALEANGWERNLTFRNPNTLATVTLWTKLINQPSPRTKRTPKATA